MKELTKSQRNEVYKKALEYHKEDIKQSKLLWVGLYGLCYVIRKAHFRIYGFVVKRPMTLFPEFLAMKPKNKDNTQLWWDNKNTNRTRLKKLKQLIEQTK